MEIQQSTADGLIQDGKKKFIKTVELSKKAVENFSEIPHKLISYSSTPSQCIYDLKRWLGLNKGARLPSLLEGLLQLTNKEKSIQGIFQLNYYY